MTHVHRTQRDICDSCLGLPRRARTYFRKRGAGARNMARRQADLARRQADLARKIQNDPQILRLRQEMHGLARDIAQEARRTAGETRARLPRPQELEALQAQLRGLQERLDHLDAREAPREPSAGK
jgi:DNA repair exonuclease SbcCD ATPase subunit